MHVLHPDPLTGSVFAVGLLREADFTWLVVLDFESATGSPHLDETYWKRQGEKKIEGIKTELYKTIANR